MHATPGQREERSGSEDRPPASRPPARDRRGASRRIGIYGGSFDPVHRGHLHVARAALDAFDLDRVLFVPAAEPPHKPDRVLAGAAERRAMLELALADEPRFEISDLELTRGGRSFTIDTVRALAEPGTTLYLILGSDNLPDFPRWREARALVDLVLPIVVHRGDDPDRMIERLGRELGADAEEKFRRGYVRLAPVEVSSTALRARRGDPELDLPPAVRAYIEAHDLYRALR